MYNGKNISLKNILWRTMNHPLVRNLNYEDAAMYAIEALRLIGCPLSYTNKITRPPIQIEQYKGVLPKDLNIIRGVKMADSNIALTYASDIYHEDKCKEDFNNNCEYNNDYTYTVQNGVITTSFKEAYVVMSYQALPIDEEGYPLIPDNQKVKNALRYHILYSHLEPLYDIGKISGKAFQRIEQNRNWYIGGAHSSLQLEGMDQLKSTMNAVNRLLVDNEAHQKHFRYLQEQEMNKKYKL